MNTENGLDTFIELLFEIGKKIGLSTEQMREIETRMRSAIKGAGDKNAPTSSQSDSGLTSEDLAKIISRFVG